MRQVQKRVGQGLAAVPKVRMRDHQGGRREAGAEEMKAGVTIRGKARVKIGASCKKGRHGHCTVQDCKCGCHGA